ncbi:zeta toxin family protein [Bifidobacterium callitrichidarum]|uniref:UDP-N-acetylglucosamine kinase n=1 Tax=Bifidobacterium callitrichidarum TaxID=2052941 RepID=A0A2U2N0A2_9BIFI|nr:zeta toxin family protein [Bifidobacterium callitrichidarum]PWG62671.1 hypothetical protein DF196_11980 [Bifidobacterium callitrichidarum]
MEYSDEYLKQRWFQRIKPVVFHGQPKSNNPATVFLGGQPAAGKTSGQEIATRLHPGLIPIVGDDYRQFYPDYLELLNHPKEMPIRTAHAAGLWTGMCVRYADDNNYSTLIEGTWRNADTVLNESKYAKSIGRSTHAIIVATPPALSRIGMLSRYYGSLAAGKYARWTPIEAHDTTVEALEDNVYTIAIDDSIDRFTVTNRQGDILADATGDDKDECWNAWSDAFNSPLDDAERDQMKKSINLIREYLSEHDDDGKETALKIMNQLEIEEELIEPPRPVADKGIWVPNRTKDGKYTEGGHWR